MNFEEFDYVITEHSKPFVTQLVPFMVSIIIPTRNRAKDLHLCLNALLPQLAEDDELIVIDNCSTDDTNDILSKLAELYSQVKIVINCQENIANLFNMGWRIARSNIISFLNDDTIPEESWVSEVKKWFKFLPEAAIIGGPTRDRINRRMRQQMTSSGLFFRLYNIFVMEGRLFDIGVLTDWGAYSIGDDFPSHPMTVDGLTITNMSVRREALETLNGFDENFRYSNIDGDFFIRAKKANMKLYLVPTAGVDHYPSSVGSTRSAFFLARDGALFYSKMRPKAFKNKLRLKLTIASFFAFWILRARNEGVGIVAEVVKGYGEGIKAAKLLK